MTVDPYAGLFDLPYVVATARVLVTTLALGGLIFLTLPRQAGATRSQPGAPMARHLTGFDEEVALGQFGEILENDSVVMTVEFTDVDGKTIDPPGEPSWRGVTMLRYETGRWRRQSTGYLADVRRVPRARPTSEAAPPEDQARGERLADTLRHPADPDASAGAPARRRISTRSTAPCSAGYSGRPL